MEPNNEGMRLSVESPRSEFQQAVDAEAYRLALKKSGGVAVTPLQIKAEAPAVRIRLMAERNKTAIDRLAGKATRKLGEFDAQKAKLDEEMRAIVELTKLYESLVSEKEKYEAELKRAEQFFESLKAEESQLKLSIPGIYTDRSSNAEMQLHNLTTCYNRLTAIGAAREDWPVARQRIQQPITICESKIEQFERDHLELFA